MKSKFVKIFSTTVFAVLIISAAISAPTDLKINAINVNINADSSSYTSIKYIKTVDNAQFFNVKIPNIQGGRFTLNISDESGNLLFSQAYNGTGFNQVIKMLPNEDNSQGNYTFNINRGNKNLDENFSVTTTTRVINQIVVTKSK